MTTNYRKLYIGTGTHVLSETVTEEAHKIGETVKLKAEFEDMTSSEKEKLEQQVFPHDLQFTVDVDLIHSKKAFLNFMDGLDDSAVYDQLWNLRPHDPRTYEAPIGTMKITLYSIISLPWTDLIHVQCHVKISGLVRYEVSVQG